MRRVNIRAAFVGEPSHASELSAAEDSDDAVALAVRGGEITLVIPQGTADGDVFGAATCLRGTLHLENERVLTFEIQDGAVGAFFEDEAADLHYRRQEQGGVGLFSLGGGGSPASGPSVLARDLMKTEVITVEPSLPAQAAAELLAFHRISGLPVLDNGRLVGVVTEVDVIGKQGNTVGEIMTPNVVTVQEDTPARDLATLLTSRGYRRVPVVRGDQLVGIVSRGDMVRWVASR
jgi:predicted transcriptional regulator